MSAYSARHNNTSKPLLYNMWNKKWSAIYENRFLHFQYLLRCFVPYDIRHRSEKNVHRPRFTTQLLLNNYAAVCFRRLLSSNTNVCRKTAIVFIIFLFFFFTRRSIIIKRSAVCAHEYRTILSYCVARCWAADYLIRVHRQKSNQVVRGPR